MKTSEKLFIILKLFRMMAM